MASRDAILTRTTKKGEMRYLARAWAGRHRSVSKTFRTKREAKAWLSDTRSEINARGLIVPSRQTLGDWLATWLETYKSELRSHVRDHYRAVLTRYVIAPETHAVPEAVQRLNLGSVPLSQLRGEDFQRLYNAMGDTRARTKRYLDTLLRQALKRAVSSRLLVESPLATITKPKNVKNARPRRTLTAEQMRTFLGNVEDHKHRALWTLELQQGLRPGEVLALRWCDVDLEARTLSVNATLTPSRTRGAPKTDNAERSVTLTRASVQALAAHRLQAGERAHDPEGLIFVTETGTPEHLNNVTRRWHALKRRLGPDVIPADMTMYELRHSYVSVLLRGGANIADMSKQLGHANVKITLMAYAWAMPDASENLADRMEQALEQAQH